MHKINAEGTIFFYLAGSEDVADVASCGLAMSMPDACVIDKARRLGDVRLIVRARMWSRQNKGDVYYLFWRNGRDLDLLDQRVRDGTYTDDDFADALMTDYQVTFCTNCGLLWHTLYFPEEPYLGAPELYQRKIESYKTEACPGCKASLRRRVVKIFGPATEDDRTTVGHRT